MRDFDGILSLALVLESSRMRQHVSDLALLLLRTLSGLDSMVTRLRTILLQVNHCCRR